MSTLVDPPSVVAGVLELVVRSKRPKVVLNQQRMLDRRLVAYGMPLVALSIGPAKNENFQITIILLFVLSFLFDRIKEKSLSCQLI